MWFPEKEQIISTSIAAQANVLGCAIGSFIPSIFFKDSDNDDPESAKWHTFYMNLTLAIIASVVFILTVSFVRDRKIEAVTP